ncbi:hypothetical protein [Nocardioides alcanivorans]|uniref:hypothetical protein n=1 Tax=Nocardioides alcanivorans TaxID=2897352 RepID=UPI001F2FCC85|nr:hypothetical protein [Nocardioides alcanivorans]
MTQDSHPTPETDPVVAPVEFSAGVPVTGDEAVDAVLADVVAAADQPLEEHVGVFERAHEGLRAALDSRGA